MLAITDAVKARGADQKALQTRDAQIEEGRNVVIGRFGKAFQAA